MEASSHNINVSKVLLNKNEEPLPESVLKQRIWREKQLHIFYGSGRPIFNEIVEKKHIFYKNANGHLIGIYT
jgi:hypothetical protein